MKDTHNHDAHNHDAHSHDAYNHDTRNYGAHTYDDMIDLPHHVSDRHPRMSPLDRAAQFSPFAALTGHDAAIQETARLTEEWIELDESRKEMLNGSLQMLREHLSERPEITFTHYKPDEKKNGGVYLTVTGRVKKIDEYRHQIIMEDGTAVNIENLFSIEGDMFQ